MIYYNFVLMIVVLVYGSYLFSNQYCKKTAIIMFGVGLLFSLIGFTVDFFIKDFGILPYFILAFMLIIFILLRFKSTVSLLYIILFMSTIIGIVMYSIFYADQSIILMVFSVFVFFLAEDNQIYLKKTYEQSAIEYQNKILSKQVEEINNIYQTMRGWRHDYHNHMQKIKAHISLEQISETKDYLNRLDEDLDNVNQLVETGNVNLDAILNSKISLAQKQEIEVEYTTKPFKELSVSDIDLCVLIGNLIDNAVEACSKIKQSKNRFIRLYIGIFQEQLYISVSNATNEVIRKMDEEYISKKRGNHGHGLKRINAIVLKYDGYINRENEPGIFSTEVLLPL